MKKKTITGKIKTGFFPVILAAVLVFGGCGSAEETEEIEVAENQRLGYGMISSIIGNEVTYYEIEESQFETLTGTAEEETGDAGQETGNGGTESENSTTGGETSQSGGESQTAGDGTGSPPDMSSGEMPDMGSGSPPDMSSGEMPDMGSGFGNRTGGGGMDAMGESISAVIPVGIKVHTTSDNVTTFSRLAAGDLVKILYETDEDGNEVIVEIWMT